MKSRIDFIANVILEDNIDKTDIFNELSAVYTFINDKVERVFVSKNDNKTILDMKCKNSSDVTSLLNEVSVNIYGSTLNISSEAVKDNLTITLSA